MGWPDNHHLNSALGWIELGNTVEARADLKRLAPQHRTLPAALAVEWRLLAAEGQWKQAIQIADTWVAAAPDEPEAWIQRSFALHERRLTQEAWDKLLPAATLFPDITTIAYNLACYACQLGQTDTAQRWLRRALLTLPDERERRAWKLAAEQDEDLKPLWAKRRKGEPG